LSSDTARRALYSPFVGGEEIRTKSLIVLSVAEAQEGQHQRVHEETLQGVQKLKDPPRIQR
jgi:hypothetical protein